MKIGIKIPAKATKEEDTLELEAKIDISNLAALKEKIEADVIFNGTIIGVAEIPVAKILPYLDKLRANE
jgi:hypothetical protein